MLPLQSLAYICFLIWQVSQDSNLDRTVLETGMLPLQSLTYICFLIWLGAEGSNLNYQIQSLVSYQLDEFPILVSCFLFLSQLFMLYILPSFFYLVNIFFKLFSIIFLLNQALTLFQVELTPPTFGHKKTLEVSLQGFCLRTLFSLKTRFNFQSSKIKSKFSQKLRQQPAIPIVVGVAEPAVGLNKCSLMYLLFLSYFYNYTTKKY